MSKLLLATTIVTVEHPKDFFGEVKDDQYIIITHDFVSSLTKYKKTLTSHWLTEAQMNRATKKSRKWTFIDQIKLNLKRIILPIILTKTEQDDYEFAI